jgi:hypothetical protein
MGAIADGIVAFAQPLIDQTDGSEEQLKKAFAITTLCFNFALVPEERRNAALANMQQSLKMSRAEFEAFQESILRPMIQRHREMFPRMHQKVSYGPAQSGSPLSAPPEKSTPGGRYPGTDRYAPCPCNSGEKYKFCCGAKGR